MPIPLPDGVKIEVIEGLVTVTGPRGTLSQPLCNGITLNLGDKQMLVERSSDDRTQRSLHGLMRTLMNNMVVGVTQGFEKRLEIIGTGYRAQATPKGLSIAVGYSHPVVFNAPDGITLGVDGPRVLVGGIDKQLVGEIAAQIRRIRPPEPYKGKGIRYLGEYVRRKAGKSGGKKR
ncbi:MAG: ribosomal protein [Chloroflexi bacterium]|nr:ribosomal protein [Chloroflexota bacterium]